MKKHLRRLLFILIIIWMITVFNLSNQPGDESSNLSREITAVIVEESKIDIIEPIIRKIAHLTEYAIRWSFSNHII